MNIFKTLILRLEGYKDVEVNIDKKSFWNDTCREVISKDIGIWFKNNNIIPWEKGKPPKFEAELINDNILLIRRNSKNISGKINIKNQNKSKGCLVPILVIVSLLVSILIFKL